MLATTQFEIGISGSAEIEKGTISNLDYAVKIYLQLGNCGKAAKLYEQKGDLTQLGKQSTHHGSNGKAVGNRNQTTFALAATTYTNGTTTSHANGLFTWNGVLL